MDLMEFESFVTKGQHLTDSRLRRHVVLNSSISDWDPGLFWEWKQKNFKVFGDFIVRSVNSFDGSEDIKLVEMLLANIHLVIPWYDENNAELCTLLLEEFVSKQVTRILNVLDSAWEDFSGHPDFSDNKDKILADLNKYRDSLSRLNFSYLDNRYSN